MLEWMADPTINCFFRFDVDGVSLDSCKRFIFEADKTPATLHYAIADENDQYLGTISLKEINSVKGSAEYAISLRKSIHGTGVAKQATYEILRIAFEELGLKRVYLNVLSDNTRANCFYQKVGFHYKSCDKDAVIINKKKRNLNWYEIAKEDYDRGLKK